VKRLGGKQSMVRTPAQSDIARFWYEGSPQSWNRIARVIVAQRGLNQWEHARLFGLLNAAMADGYIAGADTRYLYNFWRPVTAIRAGDADGNDATAGDPTWETFMNTPSLPDYPSTHSVLGGAAAEKDAGLHSLARQVNSPTSATSGSSSTPNCCCARACACSMSATTSAAVAPPRLRMKFACWSEN